MSSMAEWVAYKFQQAVLNGEEGCLLCKTKLYDQVFQVGVAIWNEENAVFMGTRGQKQEYSAYALCEPCADQFKDANELCLACEAALLVKQRHDSKEALQ